MIGYELNIEQSMILMISKTTGQEPYEVMQFFDDAVNEMVKCPCNVTRSRYEKKHTQMGLSPPPMDPIWVLRGYYPNTGIFFKVVVIKQESMWNPGYWVKVSHVRITKQWKQVVRMEADNIRRAIAERDLLGGGELPMLDLKPQRCMTPKGMKPFRLLTNKKKKPSKEE